MSGKGLAGVELYDKRFDWLVAALAAIPLVWLFYGFDAAFFCLLLFALIAALKPLVRRVGSRMGAGLVAAGVVLLASPLLRYVFYDGYCYDGPWSLAAGVSRYAVPDYCERGLLSHLDQGIWVGPLRDVAMPVAGIGLAMLVLLDRSPRPDLSGGGEDGRQEPTLLEHRAWLVRSSALVLAIVLWAGLAALNYRAQQMALEARQEAVRQALAREAAAAAEGARKLAAEQAAERKRLDAEATARQVQPDWLVGNWVNADGLGVADRDRLEYCETDNDMQIQQGGTFVWFDERGRFKIEGTTIRFFDRTRQEYGEPDAPVETLDDHTSTIERDGKFIRLDGETYVRCR